MTDKKTENKKVVRAEEIRRAEQEKAEKEARVLRLWGLWGSHFAA